MKLFLTLLVSLALLPPVSVLKAEDNTANKTLESRASVSPADISLLEDDRQRLKSIEFLVAEDSPPLIKLSLHKRTSYRLAKSRGRFYTLFIPDCLLKDPHLKLANFPPQDFPGIRVLEAKQVDDDIEITIGVEDGVRIFSFVRGNNIYIRPTAQ